MNLEAMVRIHQFLQRFWCAEEAQDLVEYTLILCAFVIACFSVLGIFMPSVKAIWTTAGNDLTSANTSAS